MFSAGRMFIGKLCRDLVAAICGLALALANHNATIELAFKD